MPNWLPALESEDLSGSRGRQKSREYRVARETGGAKLPSPCPRFRQSPPSFGQRSRLHAWRFVRLQYRRRAARSLEAAEATPLHIRQGSPVPPLRVVFAMGSAVGLIRLFAVSCSLAALLLAVQVVPGGMSIMVKQPMIGSFIPIGVGVTGEWIAKIDKSAQAAQARHQRARNSPLLPGRSESVVREFFGRLQGRPLYAVDHIRLHDARASKRNTGILCQIEIS